MKPAPSPLRVAIDASPQYGHRTGVAVATSGIIDHLPTEVTAVPYVVSGRAELQPGDRRLPLPGIVASHVWSRMSWPRADRWLGEVDLVHGTNYVAPPTSHPTLISVYDCWFLQHPERATPLVRRAGDQLRRAVDRGAWVHASSQATADAAGELLATERVRVVYLGPPTEAGIDAEHPPDAPSGAFVVAIGTEEFRKGYPDLVDAFAEFAAEVTDVDLVIAGAPGDDSARLEAALDQVASSVRRRIYRLGAVSAAEKRWLLDHARALIYPSIDEGFGFPILEAHQAGVPLVARAVGSIPEVAGEAAILVEDRQDFTTRLAEAIDQVVHDNDDRRRLIAAGHHNIARFSWASCGNEIAELYHTIAKDGA